MLNDEARQAAGRRGGSAVMTAALVVVAVLIALWLARLAWRSIRSERRSIDGYGHAMEVLGDLSSRTAADKGARSRGSGRPARAHVQASAVPDLRPRRDLIARMAARAPLRATGDASAARPAAADASFVSRAKVREVPSPAKPQRRGGGGEVGPGTGDGVRPRLVFVSDDLAEAPGTAPSPGEVVGGLGGVAATDASGDALGERVDAVGDAFRERRRRGRIAELRSSRPHFGLAVGLGSAVLAAVAISAVLISTQGAGSRSAESHELAGSSAGQTHHSSSSPPPTAPPALSPVSSDSQGAVYHPPPGTYVVDLSANGPCWIEVRVGQSGPMLFEGTLAGGQEHSVAASGPLWVRIGNSANLTATVGGMTVQLPQAASAPFNLSFEPA